MGGSLHQYFVQHYSLYVKFLKYLDNPLQDSLHENDQFNCHPVVYAYTSYVFSFFEVSQLEFQTQFSYFNRDDPRTYIVVQNIKFNSSSFEPTFKKRF
jgi:hypothetical protein